MIRTHSDLSEGELLKAIHHVSSCCMAQYERGEFVQRILSVLLDITRSESGFFLEVLDDKGAPPFARAHLVKHAAPAVLSDLRSTLVNVIDFQDKACLDKFSAQVLVKGELVFSNSVCPELHLGGAFHDQAALSSCVGIPLTAEGDVLGMIALANQPAGYQPETFDWLKPLIAIVSSHLASQKSQRDRLVLEQQLIKAKEALTKANECKVFFLATISHEIRTPMNAIVGMCDLLKDSELTASQVYFTEVISRNSDSLLSMIDEVLEVAELEAGKMEIHESRFSLEEVLTDVARALEHKLVQKRLELIMLYPPGLPRHLVGDAGKIMQILINLIDNAIKFTDSGHILVQVLFPEPEKLLVEVVDTGDGISRTALPHLFDLFHQGDPGLSRRHGGTGLGLGISQRLAVLLGGRVKVTSQKGAGSCFSLEIPVAESSTLSGIDPSRQLANLQIHTLVPTGVFSALFKKHFTHHQACMVFCHQSWAEFIATRETQHNGGQSILLVDAELPDLPLKISLSHRQSNELLVLSLSASDCDGFSENTPIDESCFLGFLPKLVGFTRFDIELERLLQRYSNPSNNYLKGQPVCALSGVEQRRPNILLVEDNPINQDVASLLLTQMGCLVDVAFNGVQALEKFTRCTYDLIFMDCQMPLMDGLTATSRIRQLELERQLARTPIVAITANALGSDRQICLGAGMDDYLSKPFRRAQVESVLDRFVHPECQRTEAEPKGCEVGINLDRKRIFDYQTMMEIADNDREIILRLLNRYKKLLPYQIKTLFQLLDCTDTNKLRAELHKLRGGAAGAGFSKFAEFLATIENALQSNQSIELKKVRKGIEQHVEQILEFSLDSVLMLS